MYPYCSERYQGKSCDKQGNQILKLGLVTISVMGLLGLSGCASQPESGHGYQYNQVKKSGGNRAKQQIRYNAKGVPNYYQVRSGDTLSGIANRFGLSYRQIGAMNGLANFNDIQVGQWLKLWQASSSTTSRTYTNSSSGQQANNRPQNHYPVPSGGNQQNQGYPAINYPQTPPVAQQPNYPNPVYPQAGYSPTTRNERYVATVYETLTFIYPTTNGILRDFDLYRKGGSATMWFYGNEGDPVYASQDGQVSVAGNDGANWGNVVVLQHANGYATRYGHNSQLLVRKGQFIRKGDVIAYMGGTGNTDRVALEFQLLQYNKPIDPKVMLNKSY